MTAEPADIPANQPAESKPKKRHHVWLWIFLIVQAIFIIWIITGVNSVDHSDCVGDTAQLCKDATDVGAGIGAMLIIGLWIGVDVILLLIKLVIQLSRRGNSQTT